MFKHKTPAGRDSLKHSEVSEARRRAVTGLMLTASVKRVTELKFKMSHCLCTVFFY